MFSPFMAVRHLMPAVPALLLLLGRNLRPSPRLALAGLALTAALGLWLAGSDYAFASVYPQYAASLAAELPPGGGQWTVGHWGWQWYAGQAAVRGFFAGAWSPSGPGPFRLHRTRANTQPAFGLYGRAPDGEGYTPQAIQVLTAIPI